MSRYQGLLRQRLISLHANLTRTYAVGRHKRWHTKFPRRSQPYPGRHWSYETPLLAPFGEAPAVKPLSGTMTDPRPAHADQRDE
jgi:hypothetical protein